MVERNFFWKKYIIGILFAISILLIFTGQPISKGSSTKEITLNFSFTEPEITEVNISNITYHNVLMNETSPLETPDLPILPIKPLKVLLPQNGVLESINITYEGNTSLGYGYNVTLGSNYTNLSGQQNQSNEPYYDPSKPYPVELYNDIKCNEREICWEGFFKNNFGKCKF